MLCTGFGLWSPQAVAAQGPGCQSLEDVLKNPVKDEVDASQFTVVPKNPATLWQFTGFIDGKEVPLKNFKAKASIVVNVASE